MREIRPSGSEGEAGRKPGSYLYLSSGNAFASAFAIASAGDRATICGHGVSCGEGV